MTPSTRREFLQGAPAVTASLLAAGMVLPSQQEAAMHEAGQFDVRSFGAKGDGKSDDTAAIQKALDAAGQVGGTVLVPPGRFACSTLRLHPRTGLQGFPTWDYRDDGGSILQLVDDKAKCLIDITGAFGATINGLCLNGATLGQDIHGILLDKPDYGKQEDTPRIERCRIGHFSGDGVHLKRVWCFSVRSCMICFNRHGLSVRGWDGFILDNWLSGNRGAGYSAVEENASVTMTGNRIEWNAGGGVFIRGGNHYNLTGNYFDRSGLPAISLLPRGQQPCRVISITGNVIYRSGKPQAGETEAAKDSCHVRFDCVRGLVFTANTMNAGRDDGGKGAFSPALAIAYRNLSHSLIKDNAMHEGALQTLLDDQGGHGEQVVVKDNLGSLFTPPAR